jgi:hypothetical protein
MDNQFLSIELPRNLWGNKTQYIGYTLTSFYISISCRKGFLENKSTSIRYWKCNIIHAG